MTARRQALWLLVLCVTLHVLGWPRGARAHDTLEDRLELDARSAVITLRVASSLATVLATVTASLPQGPGRTPREGAFLSEGELGAAAREHATYLEGHLSFEVGGRPARARAVATTLAPPFARPVHTRADARSQLVVVDIRKAKAICFPAVGGSQAPDCPLVWSPDGRYLLLWINGRETRNNLRVLTFDGKVAGEYAVPFHPIAWVQ